MIGSVKNRFLLLLLLLGFLPAMGQVYTTSKAKVHSVSTSGMGYDTRYDNVNYGNKYGPLSSFRSTSSYISSGPSYSASVPSIKVTSSFTTSAAKISGGITLADQVSTLTTDGSLDGPHKTGWQPPVLAPIGDIPWVMMVLAAVVFVVIKKRKFE